MQAWKCVCVFLLWILLGSMPEFCSVWDSSLFICVSQDIDVCNDTLVILLVSIIFQHSLLCHAPLHHLYIFVIIKR